MSKLRVLEIGHYSAGYAGRLFVRAGADVVRIESATKPPAWVSDEAMETYLHAGKRRLATGAKYLVGDLAAAADVVIVESTTATELLALGVEAWTSAARVAITPFGLTGPKRDWQATPNVLLAMAGYTALMGDAHEAPLTLPGHYVEFQAGALAYSTAMAAVNSQRTDLADIGMFETVMSLSQFSTVRWHCAGEIRSRHGSDFWFVSPSDMFRCLDGWVYVNIVPAFWEAFALFIDRPDLLVDERFETNDGRMLHRAPLYTEVKNALAAMSKQTVEQRIEKYRVPIGVVRTLTEVLNEQHLAERNYWETITTAAGNKVRAPGLPYRLNHEPRPELAVHQPELTIE